MEAIQKVLYKGAPIRTVRHNGDTWFCVIDVCRRLDLSNPSVVVDALAEDEVTKKNLGGLHGESWFCSESGLYRIIFRSNKPEAEAFRRWVFHEVLPSIRRNGYYVDPQIECARKSYQVKLHEERLALALAPLRDTYLQKAKRAAHLYGELSNSELCTLYRIPKRKQLSFISIIQSYRHAVEKRDNSYQELLKVRRSKLKLTGGVQ